jgi:putative tryptophan/tyrosine transport system permease protein
MATLLMHAVEQGLAYGIAALGIFLTYRILQFPDLTVDGSFVTGAAVASILILNGTDPFLALAAAFLAGALAGLVTGFLNARLGVANLLAGVLTMIMLYSINLRIMGRPNLSLLRAPTVFQLVNRAWAPLGAYATLAFIALLTLAVKLAVDAFLKTEVGFALRATGDSEAMVSAYGIDARTAKIAGLALSNGLVGLSGALVAQYGGFADVGMGIGTIVTGLAAVILGGSLLRSTRIGWMTTAVLVGSLVYRIAVAVALRYGYVAGLQASDLKLITAVLVLIALVIPVLRERQLRKVSSC